MFKVRFAPYHRTEHHLQGIGDKHVPFVHNVYSTDYVAGVSDAATDMLAFAFNHPEGR